MRIGIDARVLSSPYFTGIGHYLFNIIKSIEKIDCDHDFYLYSDFDFKLPFDNPRWKKRIGSSFFPRVGGTIWMFTEGSQMVMGDNVDVLWSPWPITPFYLPVKKVVTVHDFTWKYYPETMHLSQRVLYNALLGICLNSSDAIFAISKSTLNDIIKLKPKAKKVLLTYNGLNAGFKPLDHADSAKYISEKYHCSRKYFLNVGTVEPRKNIINLLRAFKEFKMKHKMPYQLLIAGAKGWKDSAIYNEYRQLEEYKNDVIFLGYIVDEDMATLYSGAEIFIFPSLYEGFGFPPLEAMACGCPVITSNSSSLPEVVGDCGLLIDPSDVNDVAQAMYRLSSDENLRMTFSQKGIERSKLFSWETVGKQILGTLISL